jgi:flagellar biosynthesis/type III secretory pathway chaperone
MNKPAKALDPALTRQHIEQLLDDEWRSLTELEPLLAREHDLLEAGNVDAIEAAGAKRQACIAELLRVDDERRALCRMLGYTADLEGLGQLMRWCDPANGLAGKWTSCLDKAGQCQKLNQRNGALVTARLRRVEGLLGVITGDHRSKGVYGPQGAYSRLHASHSLAQA